MGAPTDTVARLGGDEFAILSNVATHDGGDGGRRITNALSSPFNLGALPSLPGEPRYRVWVVANLPEDLLQRRPRHVCVKGTSSQTLPHRADF
jgi:GGDEF domain-containing protein